MQPTVWQDEEAQQFVWQTHARNINSLGSLPEGILQTLHRDRPEPGWLSLHSFVVAQGYGYPSVIITTIRDITSLKYLERRESLLYQIARDTQMERPLQEMLEDVCRELVHTFGYAAVLIGLKAKDGSITLSAQSGYPPELFSELKIRWDDSLEGQGAFGKAIRSGLPQIHILRNNPIFKPWWPVLEALSLRSIGVFPLQAKGETLGVLALYASREDYFDPERVARVLSVATQLAMAISRSGKLQQLHILNTAIRASANAIVVTERTGKILWANPAFTQLTGYDGEKVLGQNPRFLKSGRQDQAFYEQMWQTISAGEVWHGELLNRRADGTLYNEEMTITPVRGKNQEIQQFIAVKQDISERLTSQKALRESEEQFHDMFETMKSAVAVFKLSEDGQDFIFMDFNRAAEQIENLSRSQVIGFSLKQIYPMAEAVGYLKLCQQVYSTGETLEFPAFYYEDQRSQGWREGVIYKLTTGKLVLLYDDVTQRVINEQALWQEKERAQVTLASIGDAVLTTDVQGKITYLNSVAETMTGWTNEEAQSLPVERVFDIYPENSQLVLEQPIHQCLREQRTIALANHAMLRQRDGQPSFQIEDSAAPIRDREQQVIGAVLVFHDVSEKRALLRSLSHQAHHDALTDLPNRLLFKDRAHQAILQARRQKEQVAVLFLDLDDFKLVNDTLGHAAGDNLLCLVGERLQASLRQEDTVARQGGDEFLILLPKLSSEQQAAQVVQKLLEMLAAPFQISEQEIYITASLGIAIYPVDGEDPEDLIRHADMAMYQAKAEGSNHYHFYTSALNKRLSERLALQNELRRGLERQEFMLYYQPQYRLSDRQLCGMEALVRWQHPDRGLLLPGSFISIAEESGLILPLGAWVLRTACAQNKQWQEQGYPPIRVAVNLSARQFRQKDLVRQIAEILTVTGLESQWLELEITESLSMENVEQSIETLQNLKMMGICLAIDDFGTGFSSLSYLSRFPLNTLKIDRSFIMVLNGRPDGQAIVSTIIQLAQTLGLNVIAEGVETEEQLDFLRTKGCDQVQGFLLARPMPVEKMVNYFEK